MSVYDILIELANTSSRNAKIAILEEHSYNEELQNVFIAALNPFVLYYIKKIPKYNQTAKSPQSLEWALAELNALSARNVTGNAAIEHLSMILSNLTSDDAYVIERIIEKDLRCGVSESTVNTVFPDLIPSYPVMLASKYDEKLIKKFEWPAAVQTKADGLRCNAIVQKGKVEFRTRAGKLINLLGELESDFQLLNGKNSNLDMVYDGELLVLADDGKSFLSRQEGNGILSKAQKGTISKDEAERVVMKVWDAIPYPHFTKGYSDMEYVNRITFLLPLNSGYLSKKIFNMKTNVVNSIEEVRALYDAAIKQGEEGVMLKDLHAPWENKRVKHIVKFKAVEEADLICTAWTASEDNKYHGMLGSITVTDKSGTVVTDVGSGFSDEQRKKIKAKDIVGKIVAIEYNTIIGNKKGTRSLFLPIFVSVREDKSEADEL